MQLLKMELRGFKSFADKTTLIFDKGITAIVGPNGSGKSNISDAVRWVMGEQNVRQLRGQKSEDIIFAGTEKRRPQGAAEVSLYFDNSDHSLEIDFSEVVVTRRLFRSGESEFYINKRNCRLKDIHMLFADTGIGQDSMAVIGQNRVDRILNSRPEERRIIFEEVAGISRYKGRKEEGLRKIAETERNLERIRDMMGFLEERLVPMQEQAEKLKTFRHLDGERISYEGTLTLQELRNGERLLEKAENGRGAAVTEQEAAAARLSEMEQERNTLLQTMETEGETLRRLEEDSLNAHHELDGMKNRADAFTQRQSELSESEKQLAEEKEALQEKKKTIAAQGATLTQSLEAKRRELDAARKGLKLTQALFGRAEVKARQAAAELEQVTASNTDRQQQLFMLQRDTDDLRRRLEENTDTCEAVQQRVSQKQDALAAVEEQYHILAARVEKSRQQAGLAAAGAEKAKKALQAAETDLAAAEQTYHKLRNTVESLEQRIRVLVSMEQEHEGIARAVKTVLDAAQDWRTHICGLVGELCSISGQYAVAIDAALGGASQFVVAANEKTAKRAIVYLKERRAGRTTFLPLDTVKERKRTREEESASHENGIIGFANDIIQYDAVYAPVFSFLLGKTLVAESMEAGSYAAKKYGHRLRIVCLDGTQFNAGGALTGGSVKNKEASLISRRALLAEMQEKESACRKEMEAAASAGTRLRQGVISLRSAVQEKEALSQQTAMDLEKMIWQYQSIEKERSQEQRLFTEADTQLEALQHVRADIQATLVQKEEAIAAWEEIPSQSTQKLESARAAAIAEAEQCRKTMTERQVAEATLNEQVRHMEEQIRQNREWLTQADQDENRLGQRYTELLERKREAAAMLEKLAVHIVSKTAEVKSKDGDREAFYKAKESNFRHSQQLDSSLKELRERVQQWSQRISAADIQLEKYRNEIRHNEELLALQGLSRQEAMDRRREGSLKELHEKVADLKLRIAGLGQINPSAEEEYYAAMEKEKFYKRQCEDLQESRTKLEEIVAEIDDAMSEQFEQAFKAISVHFQRIFDRLFGGGSAHINLTNQQDILHAGVEILIQPPGKKQQPLTLLSGGERALTVIALLLAFLAYHPAPFCLVDEVDAALDEANVERMARYLKNYSGNTQFIVITHRRKTMEAANTLQGVTMEEKGVSRLLTVKIDELLEKGT
ncbi:chromosome segregation protein SMC [Megasphaera cerevisiae DSM 20462]|uniref:Chromosome partition protein Smc n=1 Tax=Megasphaera cerevisiae DSM 20462 TaxID=1122219 RepID=A0A0J6WXQ3_9FIRM|nr:chromosome segregation protein SMC [Megasphaera cerevisiae]KMO87409.1 chromosome segregation protein SMC [Megasphaera cerevisiae DSM 20462]SJZ38308.1 condensin subunit Smc [Megasphaera cerevisiae DSM 20462]